MNHQSPKIAVRVEGPDDGPTIVFANSLGTDLTLWDKLIPLLPAGLRIIRFDKRGHGQSDVPLSPYSMDDLVSDTEFLLDALQVKDAVFVGLSIGGMIAQGLAAKRPDLIKALVLSNTAAKMGDADMWQARIQTIIDNGLESIADGVMERWFGPEFREGPELPHWRNMMVTTPKEGYVGCCHAIAGTDLMESTAKLTMPCLGICGSEDLASPPALVLDTIKKIKGARFALIDGAGHLPCVEQPKAYARHINEFLKEINHV